MSQVEAGPDLLKQCTFNRLFLALLAIYCVAAVSSQSALDMIMAILSLALIWFYIKTKSRWSFPQIGIEWAFVGYLTVIVIGFVFNAATDATWKISLMKFSWLLNLYILILVFQLVRLDMVKIIKALVLLLLPPTLYSLISFVKGFDLITGLVNSATYHAHGNAVLFTVLIGCLHFSYHRLSGMWKAISLVSTFLLGLSIYLTYTRGIWLSIFISSSIMLFYLDFKKLVKMCSLTAVVFLCVLQFSSKLQERVQQTKSLLVSNEERVSLLKVNLQIWREYPLFGIGYGENLRRNREYWNRPEWNKPADYITSHAHNQFINVLSTTGIFGFFFFYRNIKLIQISRAEKKTERYAILMTCLWVQLEFFLACITDVSFEYAKIRALLIVIWAILVAVRLQPKLIQENTI